MHRLPLVCVLGWLLALPFVGSAFAQSYPPPGPGNGSGPGSQPPVYNALLEAHDAARVVIDPPHRNDVLTIMGYGGVRSVDRWMFVYYDPSVSSHGRAVVVSRGKIERVQPVDSRNTYPRDMSFSPANVTLKEPPAILRSAAVLARRKGIEYDNTRMLLRRSVDGTSLVWRVELLSARKSMGYVYVSPRTASVVRFENSELVAQQKGKQFVRDVQGTFMNMGGELEQFFTGKRTVDK
ncbi:MAG: hypothetical protein ACAI35_25070 [Candidatus Methylacidiphilales bacterium]|nr:hypothetical protein [Candidatus Methylacidiphilales bacterium]